VGCVFKLAPNTPWPSFQALVDDDMDGNFFSQVATHQLTLLPLMQFLSLFQGNSLEAPAATAPSRHECELIPAANQLAARRDQAHDEFDDYSGHQVPNFRLEPFIFDDRDSDRESTTMAPSRRSLWTDFDGATSSLR